MIYYLSKEQHCKIWPFDKVTVYSERIEYMQQRNIVYRESNITYAPGWWGIIEASEKNITWFLLNL